MVIKDAIETVPPFTFIGWRFAFGAAALLATGIPRDRHLWRDGTIAGSFLFTGYALQTQGLSMTTASNSGLITGLYVVFTPLLGALVARRAPRPAIVGGSALAFLGLAGLTVGDGFSLHGGDVLTMGAAAAFAGHLVVVARVARRHRVIPLTAIQLLVTAVGGLALAGPIEGTLVPAGAWAAIVLTGLGVSAAAFLLQIWAQTIIGANRTAVVLALEPAFAAATAAVVLGERLTGRGWLGAAAILIAIYVVVVATAGDDKDLPAVESIAPAR